MIKTTSTTDFIKIVQIKPFITFYLWKDIILQDKNKFS